MVTRRVMLASLALTLVGCSEPVAAPPTQPESVAAPASALVAATPTPASEMTLSPSPTSTDDGAPLTLTWTELPFPTAATSVVDVVGDRTRFVAVGSTPDGVSSWTSLDGVTWEHHAVPERSFGEITDGPELLAGMGQLVRLGDTLYSFGAMNFMDHWQGAAWRWTDGETWEVIESTSPFFDGRPLFVTASDEALLGGMLTFEYLYGTYSTWLWTPATSWIRTQLSSSADEDIMVEAAAWSAGTFLAAGSSALKVEGAYPWDWPRAPALWTSPNGRGWTAVDPPPDMTAVCSLTPLSGGRFSVLGTAGEAPAAWTVDSRMEWQQGSVEVPAGSDLGNGDGRGAPCATASLGDVLVAFGSATEEGTPVWTSSDGRTWAFSQRLDVSARYPAVLGDSVLMVGLEGAEDEVRRFFLRGTLKEP